MDDALDEPERNGEGGGEKRPNDPDVNVMLRGGRECKAGPERNSKSESYVWVIL